MAYAPAGAQTLARPSERNWVTAIVAVTAAATLGVVGFAVGRSIDDERHVGGATTARTAPAPASLDRTDLGGSIHHRGGNQP